MNATSPAISVENVSKQYRFGFLGLRRRPALADVSLAVPRGQVFGLLGPNGAGKTTLIKILLGIIRRSGGTAQVLGYPAGSLASRRRIGYLPENHRIPRHLTGLTALEYYGSLSGLKTSEIRARRPELLEKVGLLGRERERVSGYSKGMLQRLGLAQAMLHRPELIVLDEPTDGVDPVGRRQIRDVLSSFAAEGTTVFLNSHLLQEIEMICDSVAILHRGRLLRTGRVSELKRELSDSRVMMQVTGTEPSIRKALRDPQGLVLRHPAPGLIEVDMLIDGQSMLDQTIDALRGAGIGIVRLTRKELTLEDAFMQIVGKQG